MASVVKRKFKGGIAFYGKYDAGIDPATGKTIWRMIPTGKPNRTAAGVWITKYEKDERAKREHPEEHHVFGALAKTWLDQLDNRNADDDRARFNKHVLPRFADAKVADVTTPEVNRWLGEMKKQGSVEGAHFGGASQRQCLNLLSRFLGWCVDLGYTTVNPCRSVTRKQRPKQAPKEQDAPWLADDSKVRKVIHLLNAPPVKPLKRNSPKKAPRALHGEPFGYMFYLSNRCGLRLPSEVCGLRMSDVADIAAGRVRVRYSYDGPLKEDRGTGPSPKVKFAPAPDDAPAFLVPWIARRLAEGAGPEDYLFPPIGAANYDAKARSRFKVAFNRTWRYVAPLAGIDGLTAYEGGRHSFASRSLENGASLDEVSSALGHSSPVVTQRFYNRYRRTTFSPTLRAGLGLGAESDGKLVPFPSGGARGGAQAGNDYHGAQDGAQVENSSEAESGETQKAEVIR